MRECLEKVKKIFFADFYFSWKKYKYNNFNYRDWNNFDQSMFSGKHILVLFRYLPPISFPSPFLLLFFFFFQNGQRQIMVRQEE